MTCNSWYVVGKETVFSLVQINCQPTSASYRTTVAADGTHVSTETLIGSWKKWRKGALKQSLLIMHVLSDILFVFVCYSHNHRRVWCIIFYLLWRGSILCDTNSNKPCGPCDQIRNKWCIVYMAFDCSIDPSFSAGEPFPFLHYHRIWAHYLGLRKCFYLTCFLYFNVHN